MSMNTSGYQAYKKTQVQTADQGTLILMCYDGAIKFIKQAKKAHEDKDIKAFNELLTKSQNLLWELTSGLNFEAGEIARNLESLYNYMIRRLVEGQYKSNIECLDEVINHLEELKDAWVKIIKKS